MLNSLEGQSPPHIIDWLIDEHGEVIVARALGAHYEGLRAGGMDWDSLDAEVMQSLCGLVNGALAAGAVMPAPPEPDASLQSVPERPPKRVESPPQVAKPPAQGGSQDFTGQSHRLVANPSEMPTVPERLPDTKSPGKRLGEKEHRRNADVPVLLDLWKGLELQEGLAGGDARRDSFYLPIAKVSLLLERKFGVSQRGNPAFSFSLESSIEIRHRVIKLRERAERQLREGVLGPLKKFWAIYCGSMSTDEAISLVAENLSLEISEELMQEILRQGRDCCELD